MRATCLSQSAKPATWAGRCRTAEVASACCASPAAVSTSTDAEDLMAFHVMHAGCGGMVHRGRQGPEHCHAEPTVAGLWFAVHGRTVWLGFACNQHAADLIAARPLVPRDRDVLDRRRDKRRTQL